MEFTTIADAKRQTGLSYLGSVNASAKLKKNGKVSGQHTYSLYLAPHKVSGYNVCPYATPECIRGCLATSGHAGIEICAGGSTIQNARIKKTRLLMEHRDFFMAWLVAEMQGKRKTAEKKGMGFSARLNCTSDIDWAKIIRIPNEEVRKNIFTLFPDVQFYDYTKSPLKFINKPKNYHLTFSYTGRNWNACKNALDNGYNIAVVFNVKKESELPAMFRGYEVINGDLTDYRVKDAKGVIVGLKWKRIANKEAEKEVLNSCFVVQVEDGMVREDNLNDAASVKNFANAIKNV
jgi:hypothetical protein